MKYGLKGGRSKFKDFCTAGVSLCTFQPCSEDPGETVYSNLMVRPDEDFIDLKLCVSRRPLRILRYITIFCITLHRRGLTLHISALR